MLRYLAGGDMISGMTELPAPELSPAVAINGDIALPVSSVLVGDVSLWARELCRSASAD